MATQLLLIDLPPASSAAATPPSGAGGPALGSSRRLVEPISAPPSGRVRTRPAGAPSNGPVSPSGGWPASGVGRGPGPLRSANPAYGRLDDRTRELGLRGVEEARRALAAAVERSGRGTAA